VTPRDTLNPSETPNSCRADDLTLAGIAAAVEYLNSPEPEPRPFPWPFIVAVLVILAGLVVVCAFSWNAIAAALGFAGLSSMAGAQFFADAGRSAGVVR
jgi:hypothetical protein